MFATFMKITSTPFFIIYYKKIQNLFGNTNFSSKNKYRQYIHDKYILFITTTKIIKYFDLS